MINHVAYRKHDGTVDRSALEQRLQQQQIELLKIRAEIKVTDSRLRQMQQRASDLSKEVNQISDTLETSYRGDYP